MGRLNKQKRAAKQRTRARHGPPPPGRGFDDGTPGASTWSAPPPPPFHADELADTLLGIGAQCLGDEGLAARYAAQFPRPDPRTMGAAADIALRHVVGGLWQNGWLPTDIWQIVRRKLGAPHAGLVLDVIVAKLAEYAPASVPERWREQVAELDGRLWWERDRPHLGQWAATTGTGAEQVLVTVLTLLGTLQALPRLPLIAPLPGTATTPHAPDAHGIDPKVLSRVRGLLAKAESTDYPEEAEALSAKAQELMDRHAFERALLDDAAHRPQTASATRLWLDAPYIDAKAHLVNVLAEANRCRAVHYPSLEFVALVGDELDLEIVELLATSLLVQATSAMLAEGKQVTRTGASRTRSFRHSFLIAYASRIGERLDEADAAARAATDDARLLPVLADRSRAVENEFQRMFSRTVEKSVSVSNASGWHAGRAAADRADIGVERTTLPP